MGKPQVSGISIDTTQAKRYVRRKFPNADWMHFAGDGIYANGERIADGKTPAKAWENAYWAVKLGHVRSNP
jgi:hypothetical protein